MKTSILKLKILLPALLLMLLLPACAHRSAAVDAQPQLDISAAQPQVTGTLQPEYAVGFSADYYSDGAVLLRIADGSEFLLLPQSAQPGDHGCPQAEPVEVPVKDMYLAASSAMDFFVTLDVLDTLRFCSTRAQDYSIPQAKAAIESGAIRYVGKYSAPDYEALLAGGCSLAVESTMISHSPAIREQLEKLGIPVLVERSSYESSPMGRLEWIRVYGLLTGRDAEAAAYFAAQAAKLQELQRQLAAESAEDQPTVAFFYLSSNGYVNVRKPGDYLTAMIEMAGGTYALNGITTEDENVFSTMNVNWEEFYARAVDADILVYNSTIDGGLRTLQDLVDKNSLFADFKAVKTGRVYCTNLNMFQRSGAAADVIEDFFHIFRQNGDAELEYLFRLK